jgi:hypothetical protein
MLDMQRLIKERHKFLYIKLLSCYEGYKIIPARAIEIAKVTNIEDIRSDRLVRKRVISCIL